MNKNPLQFDWEDLIADGGNNNLAPNAAGPMLPVPPLPFHIPDDDDTDGDSTENSSSGTASSHTGSSSRDSSGGGGHHGYSISAVNRLAARLNMPDLSSHALPTSLTALHGLPTFPVLQSLIVDAAGSGRNILPSHASRAPHSVPVASTNTWLPAYGSDVDRFSNDQELSPIAVNARAVDAFGAGPSGTTGGAPAEDQDQQSPMGAHGTQATASGVGDGHLSAFSDASGSSGAPSTWDSEKGTAARWYSEHHAATASAPADAGQTLGDNSSSSSASSPMSVVPVTFVAAEDVGGPRMASKGRNGDRTGGFELPTSSAVSPFTQPPSGAAQGAAPANNVPPSAQPSMRSRPAVPSAGASTSADAAALPEQLSSGRSGLVEVSAGACFALAHL